MVAISELFITCDWGTTRFRLRLANIATGDTLARMHSDDGVTALALRANGDDRAALFRKTLRDHLQTLGARTDVDLNHVPIVISGMAGSSIGWRELPYANLPFSLDAGDAIWENLNSESNPHGAGVFLLSGLRGEADVFAHFGFNGMFGRKVLCITVPNRVAYPSRDHDVPHFWF